MFDSWNDEARRRKAIIKGHEPDLRPHLKV